MKWPTTIKQLGLTGKETGNHQVPCPFHEDTNASASINLEKGLLHCFTCGEGWTLDHVEDVLSGAVDVDQVADEPAASGSTGQGVHLPDDWVDPTLVEVLVARGFEAVTLPLELRVDDEGWLHFGDTGVRRNLRPDDRPRYKNAVGNKSLVWIQLPANGEPVWLTEGIFDGLTLWHLLPGHGAVATSLGADVSEGQAYELRDRTVFILYDADHTGYSHSRKVAEKLREYGANPIVVDFPGGKWGKDLNEALVTAPGAVKGCVKEQVSRYDKSDTTYVDRLFSGEQEHLTVLPTGIVQWDRFMGGGFRPGVHVLGAEPGVGKTSLVTDLAARFAAEGNRVLFVTQEISKRQQWARFASLWSMRSWMYLETEPEALEKSVRERVGVLARSVRVVSGWNANQIAFVAPHYDVIIVDYLQRMTGPFKDDNKKANVDYNIEFLSNLGREESGNIEFVAVSLVGFRRPANDTKIHGSIVKNTRGRKGMFFMEADLAHQSFKDAKVDQPTPAEKQVKAQKKLRGAE
jgi:hypothetical protein